MIRSYRAKVNERLNLLKEKKEIEDQIIKNNTFFKALITNSHDGIIVYGQNRIIQFASPSACRLLGYEDQYLEGKSIIDFTMPEDSNKGNDDIDALVKGEKETAKFRLRMLCENYRVIWVEVVVTLFKYDQENPEINFVANFRDVTEEVKEDIKQEADEVVDDLKQKTDEIKKVADENAD